MDSLLILKNLHACAIALFVLSLIGQSAVLFKAEPATMQALPYRRALLIVQHSAITLLLITGLSLLYLKNFQVQHWFYAKIILALVMLSSVMKAFKDPVKSEILWVQRRAGMILAWIALFAILALVMVQPKLF
ncbi:SirB2 family protein [Acinetobacter sp. MD2]|uniref:SirB2 family protein n=1 Tax=Acinetobacter sp. MD2 TaxID=2600066 RepID=UPI002D1E690B|nr:SirB2 family protein [Acinetobacter sp. MD2]MEB3766943.1 SirB2 family protein [Acinetobacter sp. MD2]